MQERILKNGESYYIKVPVEWRKRYGLVQGTKLDLKLDPDGKLIIAISQDEDDGFSKGW